MDIKLLQSESRLKKALSEAPDSALEKVLHSVTAAIASIKAEREQIAAESEAKQKKAQEYLQQLRDDGIDVELLLQLSNNAPPGKSSRKSAPVKYQYQPENGEPLTWTGQGRPPKWIIEQEATGRSREEFLLKPEPSTGELPPA